jgi:hypothetical protein
MQKLDLNVGSGGNANDDKDLQNSNIYYLKKPFGSLDIINQNNQVIDVDAISNSHDDGQFHNPNDNTTTILHVVISDQLVNHTIALLQHFITSLHNFNQEYGKVVNFYQIVGESTVDDRVLNPPSLRRAIYCLWFNFNSDLVNENVSQNIINSNHNSSHNYINSAYEDYIKFYVEDVDDKFENLCYIHPLLFPKIFDMVFTNNQVPMSEFENGIHLSEYNDEITKHNLEYLDDQKTVLYIYRNSFGHQVMNQTH